MDSGRLEEHKAWLFTSTLAELDTRQARTVVDDVLPDAPRLAYGVLRERIEKAAHDTDPGWAEARRAAAIARRRVSFRVAPSGRRSCAGWTCPRNPPRTPTTASSPSPATSPANCAPPATTPRSGRSSPR